MPTDFIIAEAIKEANKSTYKFRVGAILYKGPSIINRAFNTLGFIGYRKNIFEFEPTRHAEIACLHKIRRKRLKECSLLVVRINKNGNLVSAKPCSACLAALNLANIKKIYYSDYNGKILRLENRVKYSKEKKTV